MAAAGVDGAFLIDAVPAGTVSLMAVAPGYDPAVIPSLAVQAGRTTPQANLLLLASADSGGPSDNVSHFPPGGQIGAQYVGAATCMTCHYAIGAKFRETRHFKGVRDSSTGLFRYPAKGRPSCAQCHAAGSDAGVYGTVVPFDYASKGPNDPPNDIVSHISCEACHGPGSKHVSAESADRLETITRVPDFGRTCARCHTGYSKKYDENGRPVFEAGSTTYQVYNPTFFPATGADESAYMAGGSHNALGMGTAASVFNQTGGYTGGVAVTFTNAHRTRTANGCATCHMGGVGAEKHSFAIHDSSQSVIVNTWQKCHGTGFTEESLESSQAQTKLAIAALESVLAAYREAFCTETVRKSFSGISDKSTDPSKIADISRAPSLWDDSPDFVKAATGSPDNTIWIDKGNWLAGTDPTSPHQKRYNQAYWNYSVADSEGSYGIHAPTYTQHLLRASYNDLVKDLPSSASYQVLRLGAF
jgi:hypothetical protein